MISKFLFIFFELILRILFRPSDGEYIEQRLEVGDLILIASDGLFDNLYEDFIVEIINNHLVSFIYLFI